MIYDNSVSPHTLKGLGHHIRANTDGSQSIVRHYLNKIQNFNEKLHAFVDVYGDKALKDAVKADQLRQEGYDLGPLHGIPVALKDNIEIGNKVTTNGSLARRAHVSVETATVVRNLQLCGAIIIGKTHMVECAANSDGINRTMGTPWNPWDAECHRLPGGSSSGSGVAVAAGLVPLSVGTDTGGSIRVPAAWCGISSIKPTSGTVNKHGILPLSPTLDTPGVMASNVNDAYILLQAIQGKLKNDPPGLTHNDLQGINVAYLADDALLQVSPTIVDCYKESISILRSLGANLVKMALPLRFEEYGSLSSWIAETEGFAVLVDMLKDDSLPIDADIRQQLCQKRDIRITDYLLALKQRTALKHQFGALLQGFAALVTPTTPITAPLVSEGPLKCSPSHFTRIANLLDLCAVALPNGCDNAGLPISLQLIGNPCQEAMLVRIATVFQAITQWHVREPPFVRKYMDLDAKTINTY